MGETANTCVWRRALIRLLCATSMGRLVLNVLLSFAQFEREIIAERTRDKIAATRRKGKWAGGTPAAGLRRRPRRLQARRSTRTRPSGCGPSSRCTWSTSRCCRWSQELERRGWANKRWTTRQGHGAGRQAVHPDQPVPPADQRRLRRARCATRTRSTPASTRPSSTPASSSGCRTLLRRNGRAGGGAGPQPVRRAAQGAAALRALRLRHDADAHAPATARSATATTSARRRPERGWHTCPSKSVPAAEIERSWSTSIRCVGRDPALLQRGPGPGRAAGRGARWPSWRPSSGRWRRTWPAGTPRSASSSGQTGPREDNGPLVVRWPTCRSAHRHQRTGKVRVKEGRSATRGDSRLQRGRGGDGPGAVRPGLGGADAHASRRGWCDGWSSGVDYDGAAGKVTHQLPRHRHQDAGRRGPGPAAKTPVPGATWRMSQTMTLQPTVRSCSGWFSGKGEVGRLEG